MIFLFFEDNQLTQIVHEPTRKKTILDLVWSSPENIINKTSVTAPIANSDQNTTIISLNSGHTVEQEFNSETHRTFNINHAA